MRVVTWNVDSLKVRLPRVLESAGLVDAYRAVHGPDHAPLLAELADA